MITPEVSKPLPYRQPSDLQQGDGSTSNNNLGLFDTFGPAAGTLPDLSATNGQAQVNPYAQDNSGIAGTGAAFYQGQGSFTQPVSVPCYLFMKQSLIET